MRAPMRARMRGQAMVEFALSGLVVVTLLLMVLGLGVMAWQRSAIDYELSSLADELPAGWDDSSDDELVRQLVLDGSSLDPDRLEVSSASVERSLEAQVRPAVPVSAALGSTVATTTWDWVTVTATVTYDLPDVMGLGGGPYEREVHGSYLVERRYEVA